MSSVVRKARTLFAASAVSLLIVIAFPWHAGAAEDVSTSCGPSQSTSACVLQVNSFSGGALIVEFDITDSRMPDGGAQWTVVPSSTNEAYCYGEFRQSDGPGSFQCTDVPACALKVVVRGGYAATTLVGVRY
jgi:hypothetical protein